MATQAEYTLGTNAAMPIAQADIDKAVPVFFRGDIPLTAVQVLVADIVKTALDTVDAARAKTAAAQGKPT